jgi:hypothetical protein
MQPNFHISPDLDAIARNLIAERGFQITDHPIAKLLALT